MAEKKKRLLDIFKLPDASGRPTIYSLKELENMGSKRGVPAMQIKDIINDLVSEKMVDTEKIGSGNFYWSLPSKSGQRMRLALAEVVARLNTEEGKLVAARLRASTLQGERTAGKDRDKKLAALATLKEEEAKVAHELQKYRDRDPTLLREMKHNTEVLFEDCNRWSDNIHQVRQYAETWMNVLPQTFDEMYGVTAEDCEEVGWHTFGH